MPTKRQAAGIVLAIIAALMGARQSSAARERSVPAVARHDSSLGEIGMAFYDAKIHEAIALLEEGRHTDAVKLLEGALAEKTETSKKRKAELQLGLAMVQIRSAEWAKSSERLNALTKHTDDPTIAYRAIALKAARAYAMEDKETAKERLATRSGWQMALLGAKIDLWKQLEKSVKVLEQNAKTWSWDRVAVQLEDSLNKLRALASCNITRDDLQKEDDRRLFADVRSMKEMTAEFGDVLERARESCDEHVARCEDRIRDLRRDIQEYERARSRCNTDTCRLAKERAIKGCEGSIRDERSRQDASRRWKDRFAEARSKLESEVERAGHREGR